MPSPADLTERLAGNRSARSGDDREQFPPLRRSWAST